MTSSTRFNLVRPVRPVRPACRRAAARERHDGSGAAANAKKIAGYFGATATAASAVAAGHVEILLGTTSTEVPARLGASSAGSPTSPSASASSAANNGQAGGAVTEGERAVRDSLRVLIFISS